MWNDLNPLQVIGTPTLVKEMDCLTATVSEIEEVRSNVTSVINGHTTLCGFGGWFDVQFRVSSYTDSLCCIMFVCNVK